MSKTHLEETVEKLGLAFAWLISYLGIPEEKVREGIAALEKEQAAKDEKLVEDLARELGSVLDPILRQNGITQEQARAGRATAERIERRRRARRRR